MRSRPRRSDRSVLGQWIAQLRDHGVIPLPVVEAHNCACERVTCDLQHYLLHQRCLVPATVSSSSTGYGGFSTTGLALTPYGFRP